MQKQDILLTEDTILQMEFRDGNSIRIEFDYSSETIKINYYLGALQIIPTGVVNEMKIKLIND